MKLCLFFMVLCGLILICGGCAQYWYQEGKTFDQCQQDCVACSAELKKVSPNGSYHYENKFMGNCMREKGYSLVSESKLPMNAKRQPSTASMNQLPNGIAGRPGPNQ